MRFRSGKEMLDYVINTSDIYSRDKELLVFMYSDYGSIAVFSIPNEEFDELRQRAIDEDMDLYSYVVDYDDGWIYDDPDRPYGEIAYPNINWCNDNYEGEWEVV